MSVYQAINKVMDDVRSVAKNDRNTQQNFNFRGVDAVVNALSPVMRKNGLTVRPTNILSVEHVPFTSLKGALGVSCRVLVEYTFTDIEGDSCTSVVAAEANDYGDKATPKAMSVAFRTCLLQAFALPTTDVDPDAETYTRSAPAIDWNAEVLKARNTVDMLRDLHTKATNMRAPQAVIESIVAAGKALSERTVAA